MLTKTVYDIHTHNPVYAICDSATQQCVLITTSIVDAIQAGQCKTVNEIQSIFSSK